MPEAPGTIHCEMTRELADYPSVEPVGKIAAGPYQNFDPEVILDQEVPTTRPKRQMVTLV